MKANDNECAVCGGTKKFPKSETCSRECSNVIKRGKTYENRVCPVCSTQFEERIKRERRFCSEPCRLDWQARPENIAARMERTKGAVMEKYGVGSTFLVKEVQERAHDAMRANIVEQGGKREEKIKATKLEKYGNENYNNMDKNRETKAEVHGDENYNNRDKATATMIDQYGVPYSLQHEGLQAKARVTLMKNHGVTNPLKSEALRNKQRETVKERYGVEYASQAPTYRKAVAETWSKKRWNTKQAELIRRLEDNGIELVGEFSGFRHPTYEGGGYADYKFKCKVCAHEFRRKFCNPTIPICRKCQPSPTSPKTHEVLRKALLDAGVAFIENSRRHIGRYELDFVLEEHGLAVEFNGNYFHSERAGGKANDYHRTKTQLTHEKGIRLVHVFEDEITYHPDIVVSRIMSMIGKSTTSIGARQCEVVTLEPSVKRDFFEKNHIQGDSASSVALGLSFNGTIVSAMSFGSKRRALGNRDKAVGTFELVRFSNLTHHNVAGAFSKLFSHFVAVHDPKEITTYADIGWSGCDPKRTVYAKSGFVFKGFTKLNYWYFNKGDYWRRYHRFTNRKDVVLEKVVEAGLLEKDAASKLNEWELAQLLGMDRIWDCGSMKFSWSPATK